jgi:hypothetical protein
MRVAKTTAIVFLGGATLFAASQAFAQGTFQGAPTTPTMTQSPYPTGARPGNVIGTDQSLPLSNNASNIRPSDTSSVIAPRLPSPNLSDSATPRDFLIAARQALASNRTGEAQEALERAESRALAGNVLASDINQPSQQMTIRNISAARRALATGDKGAAIQAIDVAIQGM